MKVGIVGLGLIGGSLAHDLTGAGWHVAGADRDPATVRAALQTGAIRERLPAGPPAATDIPSATDIPKPLDLLVLAVPVRSAPDLVRRWAPALRTAGGPVMTDVGSTKRSVVEAAVEAGIGHRFVGGHPMAGDHRSGWSAARPGRFRGAQVWLCPAPEAKEAPVGRVETLWRAVGARPLVVDADEHDRVLALASHLPQVTATALATTLAGADLAPADLGPGGRDTTRLAASDPAVWVDILLDNADHVGPAMDQLIETLRELRSALEADDGDALRDRLTAGGAWRGSAV